MRRRLTPAFALAGALFTLAGLSPLAPLAPVGAAAMGPECSSINSTDPEGADAADVAEGPSGPITAMQVDDVHRVLRSAGRGLGSDVTVAVVDSGIPAASGLPVLDRWGGFTSTAGEHQHYFQGAAVAGLIAGPARDQEIVGIAPQVRLVDVPVYDVPTADENDDATPLTTRNLVAGLRAVAAARPLPDVVNISVTVGPDDALLAAVRALTERGVIVVASTGDRTADQTPAPGDDAARDVYPAGYAAIDPLVVAVGTTVDSGDPSQVLLPNSATTVVAPSGDAVSYAVDGRACRLTAPSAAMATAEVSAVTALLRSARPDETPSQTVDRLVRTAAGPDVDPPGGRGSTIGHGVVQAYEALTRRMYPGDARSSGVRGSGGGVPASVDPPDPDLLASVRSDAIWWGLGAGGVLAVALLLRPVMARRR